MANTKITKADLAKVQIDHAVVYLNYGETDERLLAPTRGGGEFHATATVRNIEFDGRVAATAGTQVIDENAATLKVTLLGITQENLALAIPGGITAKKENGVLEAPDVGVIDLSNYAKNITAFGKTLDGKYKKFTINNPMSEGELSLTMQQKAEGELEIEFAAHDTIDELGSKLWRIEDADAIA